MNLAEFREAEIRKKVRELPLDVMVFGMRIGDRWEMDTSDLRKDHLCKDVVLVATCTWERRRFFLGAVCFSGRRFDIDTPGLWFHPDGTAEGGWVDDNGEEQRWTLRNLIWRKGKRV